MDDQPENIVSVIVKELPEWSGYDVADIVVGIMALITAISMVTIIGLQLKHIKIETILQNKLKSLNIVDHHYEIRFEKHKKLINKIVSDTKNTSVFNNDEIDEMGCLLNQFEILAIKVKHMEIDVNIVNEITGNVLIGVINHKKIKNVIREMQDVDHENYKRIIALCAEIGDINPDRSHSQCQN